MSKEQDALKLALDALEFIPESGSMLGSQAETKRLQAITAMREALADHIGDANKMAEPSGHFLDFAHADTIAQVHVYDQFQKGQQFYTSPQPSKPLTSDEIRAAETEVDPGREDLCGWSFTEGIRWAEKHHGIKGSA